MKSVLRVRKSEALLCDGVDVFAWSHGDGRICGLRVVEGEEFNADIEGNAVEHCIRLSGKAAQDLADDLWEAGFRPQQQQQQPEGSGILQAKDAHLADLREVCMLALGGRKG